MSTAPAQFLGPPCFPPWTLPLSAGRPGDNTLETKTKEDRDRRRQIQKLTNTGIGLPPSLNTSIVSPKSWQSYFSFYFMFLKKVSTCADIVQLNSWISIMLPKMERYQCLPTHRKKDENKYSNIPNRNFLTYNKTKQRTKKFLFMNTNKNKERDLLTLFLSIWSKILATRVSGLASSPSVETWPCTHYQSFHSFEETNVHKFSTTFCLLNQK